MGNVCLPKQQEAVSCSHRPALAVSSKIALQKQQLCVNSVCQLCQSQQKYKMHTAQEEMQRRKTVLTISTQNIEGFTSSTHQRQFAATRLQLAASKGRKKSINDFKVLRGLGKGGFGKVYLIQQRTDLQQGENKHPNQHPNSIVNIDLQEQSAQEADEEPQQLSVEAFNSKHQSLQDLGEQNKQKPREGRRNTQEQNLSQKNTVQWKSQQKVSAKGRYYALKIINKSSLKSNQERQQALAERLILESVDHPFIIKLHYAFQTSSRLFLIVDLLQGGELFYLLRKMRRFQEEVVKFYAAEILLALDYLHRSNIIYRDLKPENVLLDSKGHIKITDFGLSKILYSNAQKTYSFCGTPEYLAPEIISGKGYSKAADWFSFGSLLYDMLTGSPPFQSKDKRQILSKLMTKPIYLPHFLSQNAKSLLSGLFKVDPSQRLGFKKGASQIMGHVFFQSVDFGKLYKKEVNPPFKFDSEKAGQTNKDELYINSNGFECWNSWQLNIDSPKKSRPYPPNHSHFEGFTYGEASLSFDNFKLEVTPQQIKK